MIIYGIFIVSKSGTLIFDLDYNIPRIENEKTFSYPLDLVLDYNDPKNAIVVFGQKEGSFTRIPCSTNDVNINIFSRNLSWSCPFVS